MMATKFKILFLLLGIILYYLGTTQKIIQETLTYCCVRSSNINTIDDLPSYFDRIVNHPLTYNNLKFIFFIIILCIRPYGILKNNNRQ